METEGIDLLSAIVRDQAMNMFNQVREDWMLYDDERLLYDFLSSHLRRYGVIPNTETVSNHGFSLSTVLEPCEYYVNQVADRAIYNLSLDYYQRLGEAIGNRDMQSVVETQQELLRLISNSSNRVNTKNIIELTEELNQSISESRFSNSEGIRVGYDPIDNATMGLEGGDLMIIAGRPKMKKTFYLLQMAINTWLSGNSVLFASMEMSAKLVAARINAMIGSFNPRVTRRGGNPSSRITQSLTSNTDRFRGLPPFNFITGNFNKRSTDIFREVRNHSPDVLFIDGMYIVKPDSKQRLQKHEMLEQVVQDIKSFSEDAGIPALGTIQYNRSAASTARRGRNRRTSASEDMGIENLGGTDSYGQTASLVLGIGNIQGDDSVKRMKVLASRTEGEDVDMVLNSRFTPPDFSYVRPYVEEDYSGLTTSLDEETRGNLI